MDITWYGNASVRVTANETSLLFDPFVPWTGAEYTMTCADFLPAPQVLITHGHVDHLQSVPELVSRGAGQVYATSIACTALHSLQVPSEHIKLIRPGDILIFNGSETAIFKDDATEAAVEASASVITVAVKRGRHIPFDLPLILKTLFNPRVLRQIGSTGEFIKTAKIFKENNETLVYEIHYQAKLVTLFGSLSLNESEHYTPGPDLLILPYQGNSHLLSFALPIVERLLPRQIMLDHFDDAFPPVSRRIDVSPFVDAMAQLHPNIPVIIPRRGEVYSLAL